MANKEECLIQRQRPSEANHLVSKYEKYNALRMDIPYKDYIKEYNSIHDYYAITLTIPAKKILTFRHAMRVTFDQMELSLQQEYLKFMFKNICEAFSAADSYFVFEVHPRRNNSRTVHLHGILNTSAYGNFATHQEMFHNLNYNWTCSKVIDKICKIEYLEKEMNVVNWLNYMLKCQAVEHQPIMTQKLHNEFIEFLKTKNI